MSSFAPPFKLILNAFAVLAVLVVLLTTVLLFVDLSLLRGQLESRTSEAFGRQVAFPGTIRLKPSLWPIFVAEGFRIGNPEWASRPDFARVERLEVRVALLPLFKGELQVLDITLKGADLLFEVGTDGTNNFTFGRREGPSTLPAVDTIRVLNSVIGYRQDDGELHSCVVSKAKAINLPRQPVQLQGQAACRDVAMRFALTGGIPEKFASLTVPWPLAVTVSTRDTWLVAKGCLLPGPDRRHGSAFQVSIRAEKLASLEALFNVDLPSQKSLALSGKLTRSRAGYTLADLTGQIGSTDIAAELQWQKIEGHPFLKGRIASRSLYMQDFLATATPNPADDAKPAFLDQLIPLGWMAAMDAELALDIEHVLGSPVSIDNAALTAKLSNGELSVSPLRARLAGIPLTGDLAITVGEEAPAFSLATQTRRLDVQAILEPLGVSMPVQGNTENVTLTVNSRGRTLRKLLQRADVSLTAQGGHILFDTAEAEAPWSFKVAAAEIIAKAAQPISISVDGVFRDMPLTLVVDAATLKTLVSAATKPWPLDISLHSSQVSLNATGSVSHPFQGRGFNLTFQIAGKDLSKVDSLFGFGIPLQGAYQVSGRFSDGADRYELNNLRANIGRSDIGGSVEIVTEQPRPRVIANLNSQTFHFEDLKLAEDMDEQVDTPKTRIIPEFAIPIETLLLVNLDIALKVEQIRIRNSELGDLAIKIMVDNGVSDLSLQVTDDWTGARVNLKYQMDVTTNPPNNRLYLRARDLDYGLILTRAEAVNFAEGQVDVQIELAGQGVTLRTLLSQADGRITIIGGPGRIVSREIELWISDLVRMMLSGRWLRKPTVDLNCIVSHIDVADGVATTDKLLLDMKRLTIAGSGALDLDTEQLDLLLSPNPKQASLVSFANPVRVTGTLTAPTVAVTRLPRRWTTATSGLLAGLVNPAFLLFAFSDIRSGGGNPCIAAVEQRDSTPSIEYQRRGFLQRFRNR